MIEKSLTKVPKEIISDIICDSCGASCKTSESVVDNNLREDHGNIIRSFEYMTLKADWGYHSTNKDFELWSAQICEKCVDEKFSFIKFKVDTNFS